MNTERVIEKINTACNILDSLRAELINDSKAPKGKKEKQPAEKVADALEGMIFRWDFCLTVNQPNASLEECRTQVRALAAKGIEYLNHIKEDK